MPGGAGVGRSCWSCRRRSRRRSGRVTDLASTRSWWPRRTPTPGRAATGTPGRFGGGHRARTSPASFERLVGGRGGGRPRRPRRARPATLAVVRAQLEGLARSRTGADVDSRLVLVRLVRPSGEPAAELVGFAAHPTFLGKENHLISGDWPGRLLAAGARGPRLFFQGAIGDQSVRLPPTAVSPGEAQHAAYARLLGDSIDVLDSGPSEWTPRLAVASATVALPPAAPGAVPVWLRRAAHSLLGGVLPGTARVTVVRMGPLLLVATPAEPTEAVGRSWRAAAGPDAELLSLVGGYLGYVETAPGSPRARARPTAATTGPTWPHGSRRRWWPRPGPSTQLDLSADRRAAGSRTGRRAAPSPSPRAARRAAGPAGGAWRPSSRTGPRCGRPACRSASRGRGPA